MNEQIHRTVLIFVILTLQVFSGHTQTSKKYTYSYGSSGNRESRTHILIPQSIDLSEGWNIMSANVLPEERDMMQFMQPLINAGSLVKVQDEAGQTLEDWGIFGGWTNNIGDIEATEGYKVNVSTDCTLEFTGDQVTLPITIDLTTGWNIISYPQTISIDGMDVFQSLINEGSLIKVQDEVGNTIEDWGIFGGWKNLIGNLVPGEGYKVKVNTDTQLTINESYSKSASIPVTSEKGHYYKPVYIGNGVDHMNLNIVDIPTEIIEPGDEISAYDDKLCVGTILVTKQQLDDNRIQLNVSSTDELGGLGFTKGNRIDLFLWKKATGKEYILSMEMVKGTAWFEKYESSFIRVKAWDEIGRLNNMKENETEDEPDNGQTALPGSNTVTLPENTIAIIKEASLKCYPNPFTESITIELYLPEASMINLSVYNSAGQLVRTIASETIKEGITLFKWNRTNENRQKINPGFYLCKLKAGNKYIDEILILK